MNYSLYILAAYGTAFVGISYILLVAHARYKKTKRELAKAKARAMK